MNPALILAAATAGSGLLTGLMQSQISQEALDYQKERDIKNDISNAYQMKMGLAEQGAQGEQSALSNLVNTFRSALL